MFDALRFKSIVVLNGLTMGQVAKELGINRATLGRKMSGESDFFRHEIEKICEMLKIEHPQEVFFAQDITETQEKKTKEA